MKILLVVTKSEIGGAQVFALNLARGLKAHGLEVSVAGGPGDYLPTELARAAIPFHRLTKLERSYNPFKSLGFIKELRDYVRTNQFDIVHLNSSNALMGVWGLAGLKPRPRLVFTVHGLSVLAPSHQAPAWLKAIYRFFFKQAFTKVNSLVFISQSDFAEAKKQKLTDQGVLIPNGLDLAPDYFWSREAARQFLGDKAGVDFKDAYLYGSIGRLAYPKNYEFLINSYREVKKQAPAAKLILIGEGPERSKYEAIIKLYALEKEILLIGSLPEAGRYLKAFDLFVLPSVFEGLSLTLIEAAKSGVPVLASRVGGNEEIVGAENCFELNDQAGFLEKIKSAAPVNLEAGRFGLEEMTVAYAKIYAAFDLSI
jgi:glycosyltransferase involved in cell wall biosynthesis